MQSTCQMDFFAHRYSIIKELGQGGMGKVYQVHDTQLRRIVAMKVLNPTDNPQMIQRFLREAQSVANLKHPNIIDPRKIIAQ